MRWSRSARLPPARRSAFVVVLSRPVRIPAPGVDGSAGGAHP
ncbi:hypothetical protein L083_4102 [Actinoplanes sp. N902-109]|nr:hypothetical protein L083_4102 [Actinoplanes sp. N902-109]